MLPTNAAVRLSASAAARHPDLAGVRGRVTEDTGNGCVGVLFGDVVSWFKVGDVERVG